MLLYPVDYEEIVSNAKIMRDNPSVILVREPFLLDDELREKGNKKNGLSGQTMLIQVNMILFHSKEGV